jgi:hypothetical protein
MAEMDLLGGQPLQRREVGIALQAVAEEAEFLAPRRRRPLPRAAEATAEFESCVTGTTVELSLVGQMLRVRWLPKDRQPTQTEANPQRIDSARHFDDEDLSLRMNGA